MSNYEVGQVVRLKKGHPCGSNNWRIIRVGMDFRLKCLGCGRSIMIARSQFERRVKTVVSSDKEE